MQDAAPLNPLTDQPFSSNYWELAEERAHLPIADLKEGFAAAFANSQVILVEGRAGSGKSTQVSQWCLELAKDNGGKLVVCTQPRRAAAVCLAGRVAEELDVVLGSEVGYAIRDEERGGSRLKYCTDGWLLREIKRDARLDAYGVIVVDEVHERTLITDILIHLLKAPITTRPDLKLVLLSCGRDNRRWKSHFPDSSRLTVPSSLPQAEIVHSPICSMTRVDAAVKTVVDLHCTETDPGDILVFLATQEEVKCAVESVEKAVRSLGQEVGPLACFPLHAGLSADQLRMIHTPVARSCSHSSPVGRKCVVSTNIGETGFSFDGVAFVVDSGCRQQEVYDEVTRSESTQAVPISKAIADLRAQRAGNKTIRLYSEEKYQEMEEKTAPEIRRASPERVEMMLKEYGIDDVAAVDFD